MELVNQTYSQLRSVLASMTPAARLTTALLLAVVVLSVVFLFRGGMSRSQEYLLGGRPLSSSEIAAIETAFSQANLSNYQVEGNRIRVPSREKAAYIGAMADGQALPADFNVYLDEAISQGSPFESRDQRQARLKHAREKELALIIRSWKDIESAAVQFDMEEQGGFPRKKEYTAMVAVRPRGSEELDEDRVRSIRHLVASAVAGLNPQSVTVSDLNSGRAYPGTDAPSEAGADAGAYALAKRNYERSWTEKVRKALAYVSGAVIAVNVDLDPEVYYRQNQLSYDTQPVARRSRDWTKSTSNRPAAPAGRPGVAAQQPNQPAAVSRSGGESTTEETESEQESVIGRDHVASAKAALVPKRVTVSVGVPSTYYRKIWEKQQAASATGDEEEQDTTEPDPAELAEIERQVAQKITAAVEPLLIAQPSSDVEPLVTVNSFDPPAPPPPDEPKLTVTIGNWFRTYWPTLGMFALASVSLLLVRKTLKTSAKPEATPVESALVTDDPQPIENSSRDEGEVKESALRRDFGRTGPDLREELTGLVKQDPDAAANILRTWIGSAS